MSIDERAVADPQLAPDVLVVAPAPAVIALPGARTLANLGATAMVIAGAAGFSAISLFRYVHFGANGFDLGIQDQTVWGYSRLEVIANTVLGVPNLLGDHFNPILMVLAPFYWLWPSAATLLVAQAVLLAVAMLTREDVALTVIALGLFIAVFQRRWLVGAAMAVANGVWFVLLLDVVMPAVGGVPYQHWTYQSLGKGPLSAALQVLENPLRSLQLLVTPFEKVRVGAASFANWLFLPLLSPLVLIAVPSFLERFWSSSPTFWSFHYQYSMLPAPILTFAAIDTCARMRSWWRGRLGRLASIALPVGALAASALLSFGAVHSLAELGTYVSDVTAAQIQECLDVIPSGASVAATDALVPHLSDRNQIYEVTTKSDTDYIAIDVSTLGSLNPVDSRLRSIVSTSLGGGYHVACSKGLTVVLARGAGSQQLSGQMQ